MNDIVEQVKESGEVSKLIGKLKKDKVEVEFNESQDEIDMLELDENSIKLRLEAVKDETTDEVKRLREEASKVLDKIATKKDALSKNLVKAYLVPLKYREYRLVQTAITEALFSSEKMNFDMDVKVSMMVQEKKFMTVFLCLRKKSNLNERYFDSLDDIVKISNNTLDKLHKVYAEEFELGENERKKS